MCKEGSQNYKETRRHPAEYEEYDDTLQKQWRKENVRGRRKNYEDTLSRTKKETYEKYAPTPCPTRKETVRIMQGVGCCVFIAETFCPLEEGRQNVSKTNIHKMVTHERNDMNPRSTARSDFETRLMTQALSGGVGALGQRQISTTAYGKQRGGEGRRRHRAL